MAPNKGNTIIIHKLCASILAYCVRFPNQKLLSTYRFYYLKLIHFQEMDVSQIRKKGGTSCNLSPYFNCLREKDTLMENNFSQLALRKHNLKFTINQAMVVQNLERGIQPNNLLSYQLMVQLTAGARPTIELTDYYIDVKGLQKRNELTCAS